MTAAAKGVDITLLCMMYERDRPLPQSWDTLGRRCGCTLPAFKKAVEALVDDEKISVTDEGIWSQKCEKHLTYRRDLVLGRERNGSVEFSVLVDANGDVISCGMGSKLSTGVSGAFYKAENLDHSLMLHHNHPSSNALSPNDMAFAMQPGFSGVYAHGHNGKTYYIEPTELGRAVLGAQDRQPGQTNRAAAALKKQFNSWKNGVTTNQIKRSQRSEKY
jgi:hypothetical protein